jgi:hypothetical protein
MQDEDRQSLPETTPQQRATHIVLFSSTDVASTIGRPDLLEGRAPDATVVRLPAARYDVLLQQLQGVTPPHGAPEPVTTGPSATASQLTDATTRLVILSLSTAFAAPAVLRHVPSGWLFPTPDDDLPMSPAERDWLSTECEPVPPPPLSTTLDHLASALDLLVAPDRAVVVFNVSTYDPADHTHLYTCDRGDPYAVAANRAIARLERMADELGVRIVDIDGALAELGAARHVPAAGAFGAAAAEFITEDAILLIDRSGALRASIQPAFMVVDVPEYDRRTLEGSIARWHAEAGQPVAEGDALFDLRFEGLAYIAGLTSRGDTRRQPRRVRKTGGDPAPILTVRVVAGSGGHLHSIVADEGANVRVGDAAAIVTASPRTDSPTDMTDAPRFRTGIRLVER